MSVSVPKQTEINLTESEKEAYKIIKSENGIHQSELWKIIGCDSRTGSRLANSLEEKELITRENTVYNGHNTYKLNIINKPEELDFSLLMAGDMISPFIDDDEIDPMSSEFTEWLMKLPRK